MTAPAGTERGITRETARYLTELALLDEERQRLEDAAALTDPRERFEAQHRVALRVAGIEIRRNALARRRRAPLNAWEALVFTSPLGASWARRFRFSVELRADLEASSHVVPDAVALERHRRLVVDFLDAVAAAGSTRETAHGETRHHRRGGGGSLPRGA